MVTVVKGAQSCLLCLNLVFVMEWSKTTSLWDLIECSCPWLEKIHGLWEQCNFCDSNGSNAHGVQPVLELEAPLQQCCNEVLKYFPSSFLLSFPPLSLPSFYFSTHCSSFLPSMYFVDCTRILYSGSTSGNRGVLWGTASEASSAGVQGWKLKLIWTRLVDKEVQCWAGPWNIAGICEQDSCWPWSSAEIL